jgi:hypothetical protein
MYLGQNDQAISALRKSNVHTAAKLRSSCENGQACPNRRRRCQTFDCHMTYGGGGGPGLSRGGHLGSIQQGGRIRERIKEGKLGIQQMEERHRKMAACQRKEKAQRKRKLEKEEDEALERKRQWIERELERKREHEKRSSKRRKNLKERIGREENLPNRESRE